MRRSQNSGQSPVVLDQYGIPMSQTPADRIAPIKTAASTVAFMVLGMWIQEIVDFALQNRLDYFGIQPKNVGNFWHIFTAPFLHGDFSHLMANTVPFIALAFMTAVRSLGRFFLATLSIIVVGGALVWLVGDVRSIHLGASQLIFGYLAYLLGVGWWERTPAAIGVALVAFFLYGGILWGVLPSEPNISWEAHLFGFIGGLVAAMLMHRRVPSSRHRS